MFLAHIPLYLYPFLHTVSKTRPFEYLRLTSLGVIGALVKVGSLICLAVGFLFKQYLRYCHKSLNTACCELVDKIHKMSFLCKLFYEEYM